MNAVRVLAVLLVALTVLPPAAAAQAEPSVELTDAAIIERDTAVEVWVRLSREARYQSELMDGPYRLVLDFEDTAYRWVKYAVPVAADPVRQLRGSQYRKGVARLVIELQRKVAYTIDVDREGLRIVIPREAAAGGAKPPAAARPAPSSGWTSVRTPTSSTRRPGRSGATPRVTRWATRSSRPSATNTSCSRRRAVGWSCAWTRPRPTPRRARRSRRFRDACGRRRHRWGRARPLDPERRHRPAPLPPARQAIASTRSGEPDAPSILSGVTISSATPTLASPTGSRFAFSMM